MQSRRALRVVLACAALALPLPLVSASASGFVEPLSRVAVSLLLAATAPLDATVAAPLLEAPTLDEAQAPEAVESLEAAAQAKGARPRAASRPQPPAALFVSAETVLRLTQSAARPQGAFVPATAQHPAGLRLSGVAALGIGVQDGDVLVEALGVAPRSPGQIIGAIIEARAKQVRYLSGTIWRRGQTIRITVEQPYLPAATVLAAAP